MSFRLTSLVVEDFRSIRGTQRVSLDAPVVLIHGPNGTGKTSLLSAIEFSLTGAVASLGRFDPGYVQHLPHKKSPTGKCRVVVEATGLSVTSAEVVSDGAQVRGAGLLSGALSRFFTERCYLPQAALGRLLEIYEYQDSRRSDSPLTRFVKELLGLEALDALIKGLHASGDVRRMREPAPTFWAARAGAPIIAKAVTDAENSLATFRRELTNFEQGLRPELGDLTAPAAAIDANTITPQLRTLIAQDETRLGDLARRRRDLMAAADQLGNALASAAEGQRETAEAAVVATREALQSWWTGAGSNLLLLLEDMRRRFPELPDGAADPLTAHHTAVRLVVAERERLLAVSVDHVASETALTSVQEALRQGNARMARIDAELAEDTGANQELAQALTAISSHINDESCPVCGRAFSEVSDTPLASHVSEEVQQLIAAAGRVQALVRDRATTLASTTQAQRQESEIKAKLLSSEQLDSLKVDIALLTEWNTGLAQLEHAATEGRRLQVDATSKARDLSALGTQQTAVAGLRAQLVQHAEALRLPAPDQNAPLKSVLATLIDHVQGEELTLLDNISRRRSAIDGLGELRAIGQKIAAAEAQVKILSAERTVKDKQREESERRIAIGRELAGRAQMLRSEKVRQVFNEELNSVWRELFIRLAPDEEFVPAFALPKPNTSTVEAILETHYRSGGKGGNPRSMLSAGNLNTAALTLFLALQLSVKPVLPCLIIDDPVQSMDDVHIAQFAALLRTLKQDGRQVILAVHDRQLFDYLTLELSPTINGDRLITIELGRSADGMTTAPWRPTVFEPDKAIAA